MAEILDLILRRDRYTFIKFCDALRANGQECVVIKSLSSVRICFDVPIAEVATDKQDLCCKTLGADVIRRITTNWNDIVLKMNPDEIFMGELQKCEAFTTIQINKFKVYVRTD